MNFVYCPAQIRAALVAARVDLRILLDISKLANILSPEDVAFYLHLNLDTSKLMPVEVAQSLRCPILFSKKGEMAGTPFDDLVGHPAEEEIKRALNEYSLNGNAPVVLTEGQKLSCDLMDENTIIFSHTPLAAGEAADTSPEGLRKLLDRLIQQLVVFHPFEVVAAMPIFGRYLRASQAVSA